MSVATSPEMPDYRIDSPKRRAAGDDVEYYAQWCSYWSKHGHERIYFNDTGLDRQVESWDGYVDLVDGGVHGTTPIETVAVEDGRVEYRTEKGTVLVSRPL